MTKKEQPTPKSLLWICIPTSIGFAILLASYIITGHIRVSSSRENQAYYIEYAERPRDFILISSLVGIVSIGSAIFYIAKSKK